MRLGRPQSTLQPGLEGGLQGPRPAPPAEWVRYHQGGEGGGPGHWLYSPEPRDVSRHRFILIFHFNFFLKAEAHIHTQILRVVLRSLLCHAPAISFHDQSQAARSPFLIMQLTVGHYSHFQVLWEEHSSLQYDCTQAV